ncbi:uncharacterized protein LOC132313472 [Cornus florida]|uniref:uncharacterized protein LOC132313472 n=1 Tax=Cornus florida TaxID=4283 RepID=UPI0028A0AD63|nr:uncharacterized protein LOC132313472 [Cornus florida]
MGVGLLDIGVQIQKFMVFAFRRCYRSVCNHPFLVGLVLFLIFLYRSFPFLFSLFVSASPVLVCTAVLLGTLLSFGQSNIPEIEKEEERIHEILSLKTGVSSDAVVVERDESFDIERYTDKRRDVVEKSIQEASSTSSKVSELDRDDNSFLESSPLIQENSREIQFEKRVIEEEERELLDSGYEKKSEVNEESPRHGEVVENQYSLIHEVRGEVVENQYSLIHEVRDEIVNGENDKSSVEYVDSRMAGDFDSSQIPPWRQVEAADHDDEASDYGSDDAESSSPDASMADIIPMLDELHPLLDEDATQPGHKSHSDSDAASERSQKSSDSINELDADAENQEEEEVGDDDDEEEDAQGGKEDAVTWTEDDQKNLMDLGTSELERNQRLENLIARRRARKDLRMMAEKNLIDLDSSDLPFNIAPISITRRNPFDLPYDSNDNMGLPPIPGSAPSILLPRRNPFDLPYDSSEEKPDLTEDSFQEEYKTFHQKETLFRRHESFSVGPSLFGPHKQEKQGSRLRPYFVPERMASERTSFSYFQRQSSELSESQVSSIPETESMCSAGGQEVELISSTEHVYELVKDGSESSEELDTAEFGQSEKKDDVLGEVEIKLGGLEYYHEMESSLSVTGDVATPMEHDTGGIHLNTGAADSIQSSISLLSEVNGKVFDEKEDEGLSIVEPRKGNVIEESGISMQPSLEESGFNFTNRLVDDSQHKEPVYDLSPTGFGKKLSSSSVSSELQVEIPETGLPAVLDKRTIPFADRDSGVSNQSIEKDTPISEKMFEGSSHLHAVDENELELREVTEISEHDVMNFGFALVDRDVDSENASILPDLVFEHASNNPKPSKFVEDHFMYQDDNHQHEQNEVASSIFDTDIHVVVQQDVGEKVDSVDLSSQYKLSGDLNLFAPEDDQASWSVEQLSGIYPSTSSETELIVERSIDKEVALQFEQYQVHSSSSDANFLVDIHHEADDRLVSTHYQYVPEKSSVLELEKQMSSSNKSMVQLSSDTHEEQQEPLIIQLKSIEEVGAPSNLNVSEVQEPSNKVQSNIYSPLIPDTAPFPFEVSETRSATGLADLKDILDGMENKEQIQVSKHFNYPAEATGSCVDEQNIIEEADKIKEIDEGLLLELDAVGDFSVKEFGSKLNDIENHLVPAGERFLVPRDLETKYDGTVCDLIEADKIEPIVEPENPSAYRAEEEIHQYQDVEGASEFQMSGASYTKHIGSPVGENFHREVEIPMDFKSVNDGSLQKKTEIELADSKMNQISILDEISSGIPVVETQSVEDIDSMFFNTKIEFGESEIPHQDQSEVESISETPVLGARSLDDIDSDIDQIDEEEIKQPIVTELLHAEQTPEETEPGCSEHGILQKDSNLTENKMELPVIEATSVEDIGLAFKSLHEDIGIERRILPSSVDDNPDVLVSKDPAKTNSEIELGESEMPRQDQIGVEITSEMPVLEAHSLEDIDSAFKQIGEEKGKKPIVTESLHAELTREETEPGCSEHGILHEDSNLTENKMELPVIEATSVEDIGLAFKSLHDDIDVEKHIPPSSVDDNPYVIESKDIAETNSEIELGESEIPHQDQIEVEINSEMPVLEAGSLEDIDSAFKQIGEEKIKKPIVTESLHAELTPEETEPGCSEHGILLEDSNLKENKMELPVIEARSVEDIGLAFKSLHEDTDVVRHILPSSVDDNPDVIESKDPAEMNSEIELGQSEIPHQDQIEVEINSEIPVLEAHSFEDIDSAFKQIGEEKVKEPIVTESLHAELTTEETEPVCSEHGILHQDSNLTENNLELPVIEARSVEDIGLAFQKRREDRDVERHILPSSVDDNPDVIESKVPAEISSDLQIAEASSLGDTNMIIKQVAEGNLEKPLKSDSEGGYARTEANEVGSSKEDESSIKEFGVPETSTCAVQTSEGLNLSMSHVEEKKA